MTKQISLVVLAGIVFGCLVGNAIAQSDLFRLRVALVAPLVSVDGTINERYQVSYLLDNSSCILMILDKGKDSISITQVNKASCNHLVTK